jgi:hypothetical protein
MPTAVSQNGLDEVKPNTQVTGRRLPAAHTELWQRRWPHETFFGG